MRKSPCVSMPPFRSPLSRMILLPRVYLLGAWLRSPSVTATRKISHSQRSRVINLNVEPEDSQGRLLKRLFLRLFPIFLKRPLKRLYLILLKMLLKRQFPRLHVKTK
uniref:Uncharacterized protein n=1 Tax=Arundo donax TaxID=35708 RepID=A0A0A9HC92_ARUDO